MNMAECVFALKDYFIGKIESGMHSIGYSNTFINIYYRKLISVNCAAQ